MITIFVLVALLKAYNFVHNEELNSNKMFHIDDGCKGFYFKTFFFTEKGEKIIKTKRSRERENIPCEIYSRPEISITTLQKVCYIGDNQIVCSWFGFGPSIFTHSTKLVFIEIRGKEGFPWKVEIKLRCFG